MRYWALGNAADPHFSLRFSLDGGKRRHLETMTPMLAREHHATLHDPREQQCERLATSSHVFVSSDVASVERFPN